MRAMQVEVLSPGWIETFSDVVHVRIEVLDGSRGVQPGHEVARAQIIPGPVEMTFSSGEREFLATEGGLAWLEGSQVCIVTPWAAHAKELGVLAESVRSRGQLRVAAEQEARAVARRHENAAQRALVALRRGGPR